MRLRSIKRRAYVPFLFLVLTPALAVAHRGMHPQSRRVFKRWPWRTREAARPIHPPECWPFPTDDPEFPV